MVDGKKILGIDLGTTNSSAAVFYGGEARIVKPDDEGEFAYNLNSIASCVVLDENGDVEYVGNPAKEEALLRDDKFVITNFKRKIGEGEVFKFPNKIVTLEEVASEIIRQLKETAERNFDITLDEAIFSVPVYFTNNQKEAIKYAAELAGLNVRRLIPEPISAYVDYNYSNENQEDMGRFLVNNRFLVFDMGGGTLDISIIDYPLDTSIIDYYSTERNIPELSRGGDNNLGGEDMNDRIFDYVVNKFKEETNIDIREEGSISPLKREVEKAKIYLSTHQEYRIILPNIAV